ncbi:MAG: S1C family serine protease [Alphaproteobacteria bacterium]
MKQVDYANTIQMPHDANPTPIEFTNIRYLLPPGMEIGLESGMGPEFLGGFCSWQNYPVSRRVISRKFEKRFLDMAFEDALESIGYDVTNDIDIDFQRDDAKQRAEYFISVKVTDVDLDMCERGRFTTFNIFNTAPRAKGKLYARFEWSVYNALRRTTVYKTTTEGYSRRDYPNLEALQLLFMDAFDMAAHNLGTDKDFYNLIVLKKAPPKVDKSIFGRKDDGNYPRKFRSDEEVAIPTPPLSKTPFDTIAHDARKVAVMAQKRGHGSGVFITRQGHILTNYHVIGDSRRIRIVTGFRKTGITAEVLRVDKVRDVALLKLEEIPDWLDMDKVILRPTRLDWPKVGETIYAIGVPKDYKAYRNTVTKGIVSAHRNYKRHGSLRLNFIQGDVEVHPGSSGGPVVDENGNLIGLVVEGEPFTNANGSRIGIGLNLFIPIQEALDAVDVSYE